MESRADVYGVGLLEKGRNFIRQTGDTLQRAAAALLGMLLSNVALPGEVSPFGAAFAIAAPPSLRIASIVGAVLGYIFYFAGKAGGFLVGGLSGIAWQGLGGLVLALGIERTASAVSDRRYAQAVKWSGIFLAGALPPLAAGLLDRLSVGGLILCLCQGCLMAGACWLFHRAFRWVELSLTRPTAAPRDRPESADVASVLLTAGLLSGALSRLCVGRISVGRVLALTVILLFGCRKSGGSGLGAAAGVTAGILAALCGPQRGMASISGEALPGIWGIGGLLAGLFAPLGRGFCCAAMLLGETASIFLLARDESTYILLAESLAAGVLFLLVPPRAVILTERWLGGEPPENGKKAVGELLLSRLQTAGSALADIAQTTEAVSQRLLERDLARSSSPDRIYRSTIEQVCRRCPNGMECWTAHYSDTVSGIGRLHQLLREKDGEAQAEEVAACFAQGCIQPDKLAVQAERDFRADMAEREKKRTSTRVRGVVTDQFEGLSMVMEGMAGQLRELRRADAALCKRVEAFCAKRQLEPRVVECCENTSGRMIIEMVVPFRRMERVDKGELALAIGELCQRDFEMPEMEACDGGDCVRLRFWEQTVFRLVTGSSQMQVTGSRVCGDSCAAFQDGERHAAMLISDGMGTGMRAAMDSAMASGLLSRLLRAGIEPAAALKLVNGALLVKSEDESLATLDLARVDLYTGKAEFFKAGAAPTFLLRGGHAGSVEAASLPAGILNDAVFERAAVALREGDMIVMVSDGAMLDGGDWISEELEEYEGQDPDWLATHLAKCARERFRDRKEDDITVMVGIVAQNG